MIRKKKRLSKCEPECDFINIQREKGKTSFDVSTITFIDKDTKQYVIYLPSFDISGYGSTKEKAMEMIKHSVSEIPAFHLKQGCKTLGITLDELYNWAEENC